MGAISTRFAWNLAVVQIIFRKLLHWYSSRPPMSALLILIKIDTVCYSRFNIYQLLAKSLCKNAYRLISREESYSTHPLRTSCCHLWHMWTGTRRRPPHWPSGFHKSPFQWPGHPPLPQSHQHKAGNWRRESPGSWSAEIQVTITVCYVLLSDVFMSTSGELSPFKDIQT